MSYTSALLLIGYVYLVGMGTGYLFGRIHERDKQSPEVPR
jgi:hypothetical protein